MNKCSITRIFFFFDRVIDRCRIIGGENLSWENPRLAGQSPLGEEWSLWRGVPETGGVIGNSVYWFVYFGRTLCEELPTYPFKESGRT